ncbi:MAG: hypothetical protein O3A82_17290 [Verrucomicrobia bacterium]|nr:hypothetical protein [Verrucomicrobiota bacterium]
MHGKLFQGRYKSLIVEEESYLGALLHYAHLNPVRAGMRTVIELKWELFLERGLAELGKDTVAITNDSGYRKTTAWLS